MIQLSDILNKKQYVHFHFKNNGFLNSLQALLTGFCYLNTGILLLIFLVPYNFTMNYKLSSNLNGIIWDKVFKNGPSKIYSL